MRIWRSKNVSCWKNSKPFDFWENDLKASLYYVLSMIKHGYHLTFKRKPSPFIAKNNASSLRHKDFVEDSIKELLVNRCIEQVDTASYCCNPLTVAEGEKLRLVLDLRHVNKCLEVETFKYENLKTVAHLFEGYYFGTFDLRSGYHHVPIAPEHRKYLGFAWTFADGILLSIFNFGCCHSA